MSTWTEKLKKMKEKNSVFTRNTPKPYKPLNLNQRFITTTPNGFGKGFRPDTRPLSERFSTKIVSKEQKKEEKQMKEVYDKVILNGGKKKTAEEKIMDQVINGK